MAFVRMVIARHSGQSQVSKITPSHPSGSQSQRWILLIMPTHGASCITGLFKS